MSRPATIEKVSELTPAEYLRAIGEAGEGPHDIATAALMLAALDRPEKKRAQFVAHFRELAEADRVEADFAHNGETGARALSSVIAGAYGYEGERAHYDD